ncbi:MAG TPA: methyltransferase domain-containing protein [Patescibacteria group bacterium]|nr:methyltransferase domain-containing protein [Patescibacteria group bacterium]
MPELKKMGTSRISGGNSLLDPYYILEEIGLGAGMRIADFGCGAAGHFVIPAGKIIGKNGVSYAVDLLKPVLSAVKSRARFEGINNVEAVWSNLEIYGATKIKEGSLDFVLLANTLFQIKKNEEMFKEAIRLVKNNGKIAVVEWKLIVSPLGPPAEKRLSKDFVRGLAKKYGLEEVKEFKAGPYHYGLVFEKNK